MIRNEKDKTLLALLKRNSRMSVSELARLMQVSRSTISDHIARLEKQGIIKGYTLILGDEYEAGLISGHVMMSINPKQAANIIQRLKQMDEVEECYAVSGQFDLIAIVRASAPEKLDKLLDGIATINGVEKTLTSIVLSRKV